MRDFTKADPGCYHSALKYLSELTGIEIYKEIRKNKLSELRNKTGKKLLYHADSIKVVDANGKKVMYMQDHCKRFDQCGIIADHFIIEVLKDIKEFGIEIKPEGSYKDSLGDGWYDMVSLYSINGNYFANMECTCISRGRI